MGRTTALKVIRVADVEDYAVVPNVSIRFALMFVVSAFIVVANLG